MFKDKSPEKWGILIFLFLLVLAALLLFFGLNARANEKFLNIKNVETPAGLSVWLVEDHSLPVISVKYQFEGAGSANDPANKQGLARMLSNTMDEGAGGLSSEAFQKELTDNSITLTFDASRDDFGGELKTLSRTKDKAFNLLSLAINAPRFDEEPVARMRDGNLSRIKSSMSDPDWMAARLLNDKAFGSHPYAQNSGGTLSSLPAITPEDLRAFKKDNLSRDRLLIAIAGDITPEEAAKYADKVFATLPEKSAAQTIKDVALANPGKVFLFKQPIPQTMVEVALPGIDHTDKDYYALQVMNYIYGGAGFGSRLMETAREQRGLTYGVYSYVQDMEHGDSINISTSTKNASAGEMLDIIRNEMATLKDKPVGAKELADAKAYMTGSMPLSLGSTENIANVVLSLRAKDYPIDYLDHYAAKINAVTAADVERVAKRVLNPDQAVTVLVGEPANINNAQIIEELPNVR